MTSEATPVVPGATPAAEEQTAPRTRSTQDRIMENKIIAAEQLAKILPAETDLAGTLSEADYGAQELVRFDTLQQKAWKDYVAQGLAAGEQKNATKRFLASEKAARKSFVKERGKGKAAFMKDPIGREIVGAEWHDPRQPDRPDRGRAQTGGGRGQTGIRGEVGEKGRHRCQTG